MSFPQISTNVCLNFNQFEHLRQVSLSLTGYFTNSIFNWLVINYFCFFILRNIPGGNRRF